MDENLRRWLIALGPLVGVVLLLYVVNQGVEFYRQGEATMRTERRAAATATARAAEEVGTVEEAAAAESGAEGAAAPEAEAPTDEAATDEAATDEAAAEEAADPGAPVDGEPDVAEQSSGN